MKKLKVSVGVLEAVGRLVWRHDLSLKDAQRINSNHGWPIAGLPGRIQLTEEELASAVNDYGKKCQDPKLFMFGFKDSKRNNAIFMALSFILAIYSFEEKIATKGVNQNLYGCLLMLAGLYFTWKLWSLSKERKELTRN